MKGFNVSKRAKTKYPHKCATKHCRGLATKSSHSNKCSKCRGRQWRKNHPAKAHYHDLRNRAKQRGHEFTISFEYYHTVVWLGSGYAEKHGKTKESLSVDRIKNHLGYIPGNLQVMTVSENSRKRFVPYFKNKADEDAAIKEAERKVREAFPNGGGVAGGH